MSRFSRRDLLRMGVIGAAGGVAACGADAMGGGGRPAPNPTPTPAPGPTPAPAPTGGTASGLNRVRMDASGMSASHPAMRAYAEAVRRMKALPASDPRSWSAQAMIHLQSCPHGNWWFLPWHRAYLRHFEDICRGLLGDEGFVVPYWNWSRDARIPSALFDLPDLAEPSRVAGRADSAAFEMVSASVVEQILTERNFEVFGSGRAFGQRDNSTQGPLEARPHNHVHVFVGGQMATFASPLDPAFWLHHANIDRLWEAWNQRGGVNSSDPAWGSRAFSDFVDRNGARVSPSAASVSSMAGLGYSYDSTTVAALEERPAVSRLRATGQNAPNVQVYAGQNAAPVAPGRPHSLRVTASRRAGAEGGLAAPAAVLAAPASALARVAEVDAPAANENVIVRVFVNCPYLSSETPVSDPHYVGSFSFFQTRYAAEACSTNGQKSAFWLDATEALRRVGAQGGDGADLQIIAVPLAGRSTEGAEFFARAAELAAR